MEWLGRFPGATSRGLRAPHPRHEPRGRYKRDRPPPLKPVRRRRDANRQPQPRRSQRQHRGDRYEQPVPPQRGRGHDRGRAQAGQRLAAGGAERRQDGSRRQRHERPEGHEPGQSKAVERRHVLGRGLILLQPLHPGSPGRQPGEWQREEAQSRDDGHSRHDLPPASFTDQPQGCQARVRLEDGPHEKPLAEPRPQGEESQSRHGHVANPQPLEERWPGQGE